MQNNQTKPLVVTLGESLIDQVVQEDNSHINVVGGSPLNTALALSRQGINTSLVSRISSDELGQMILDVINESEVDTSKIIYCTEPTTRAIATPDGKGGKQYTFDIDGTTQGTWEISNLAGVGTGIDYVVVTAALAAPIESMRIAFDSMMDDISIDENKIIVFDPNVRPALISDKELVTKQLEKWISQSDVVKASMEDVLACWPETSFDLVAKNWMDLGASLVVITDGEQGAHAFSNAGTIFIEAVKIEDTQDGDTIGAGDTFTAGLVKYFIENNIKTPSDLKNITYQQLEEAITSSTYLAGETCKRLGANPPWDEQVFAKKQAKATTSV